MFSTIYFWQIIFTFTSFIISLSQYNNNKKNFSPWSYGNNTCASIFNSEDSPCILEKLFDIFFPDIKWFWWYMTSYFLCSSSIPSHFSYIQTGLAPLIFFLIFVFIFCRFCIGSCNICIISSIIHGLFMALQFSSILFEFHIFMFDLRHSRISLDL